MKVKEAAGADAYSLGEASRGADEFFDATRQALSALYADDHSARSGEREQAEALLSAAYTKLSAVDVYIAARLVDATRERAKGDGQLLSAIKLDAEKHGEAKAARLAAAKAKIRVNVPVGPPPGWIFERVDDRNIRVADPCAPYTVVLNMGDQAPVMRVFWRLVVDLIEAAQ